MYWTMGPPLMPVLFLVAGGTFLLLVGNHRRARREGGATWLFAAGVALILLAVAIFTAYDVGRNTVHFRYTATLTPSGSGSVRVSLPIPVDEALIANLVLSPDSSSAVVNRTGDEPSIDVTLSGRTTLTASFSAYRYSGPTDLTRADSLEACAYPLSGCNAAVSLLVVSGNVTTVHVMAQALWSRSCDSPFWELDALALPGEREYPAAFGMIVC